MSSDTRYAYQSRWSFSSKCLRLFSALFVCCFVYLGKQAVLVLNCDNPHMNNDVMVDPGLVMIFAHGVEWVQQLFATNRIIRLLNKSFKFNICRALSCHYNSIFQWSYLLIGSSNLIHINTVYIENAIQCRSCIGPS